MINPGLPERSPADSKIMAYADISNSDFIIKGFRFKCMTRPEKSLQINT